AGAVDEKRESPGVQIHLFAARHGGVGQLDRPDREHADVARAHREGGDLHAAGAIDAVQATADGDIAAGHPPAGLRRADTLARPTHRAERTTRKGDVDMLEIEPARSDDPELARIDRHVREHESPERSNDAGVEAADVQVAEGHGAPRRDPDAGAATRRNEGSRPVYLARRL